MPQDFKPLSLQDKPLFDRFLTDYPQQISELTFTNLFCWRLTKNYNFGIVDGHLLLSFNKGSHSVFLPPIGPNPVEMIRKIAHLYEHTCFTRIDGSIAKQLGPEFLIKHDRDMDDYVYDVNELRDLAGKKYDGKRNLIKNFESNNPKICQLDGSKIGLFTEFQQHWCRKNNCASKPDLLAENLAIEELLYNLKTMKVFGICILINDRVEGFSIGEPQNDTTIVEHFEKANTEFKGIYQYLLNSFVKTFQPQYTLLNREQDLGIPGLRKSKLSYHPVQMIEKYSAKLI